MDPLTQGTVGAAFSQSSADKKNIFKISIIGFLVSLIDSQEFNDVINFAKQLNKHIVITRGEKGAVAINNREFIECRAKENLNIADLTGAGDLFAAGYLHGIINDKIINLRLRYFLFQI